MNRRHFLMGLAAAAALPHRAFAAFAPEQFMQIPLWNGTPPGGGGPTGPRIASPSGAIRHISEPDLSVLTPRAQRAWRADCRRRRL